MTSRLLALFYLLTLCALIVLLTTLNGLIHNARLLQEYEPPQPPTEQHIINDLLQEIQDLRQGQDELLEIFSRAETFTITAYAPLDPNAIEGMCYSGNPNITASGLPPIPGETVAAGPSIPFGTRVWIEGIGIRTANDRGGRITDRHIDLVMETRAAALRFGRQTRRVVVL